MLILVLSLQHNLDIPLIFVFWISLECLNNVHRTEEVNEPASKEKEVEMTDNNTQSVEAEKQVPKEVDANFKVLEELDNALCKLLHELWSAYVASKNTFGTSPLTRYLLCDFNIS